MIDQQELRAVTFGPSTGEQQHDAECDRKPHAYAYWAPSTTEQPSDAGPVRRDHLDTLREAIVSAFYEVYVGSENPEIPKQQQCLIAGRPVPKARFQQHVVEKWLEAPLRAAGKHQKTAAQFLRQYTYKLERIACQPNEVAAYLRSETSCLASLYLEAMQPKSSPLCLRQLAVRFATDARHPFSGDLKPSGRISWTERVRITKTKSGLEFGNWESGNWECSSMPAYRLFARDFLSSHVLKLAFNSPPSCAVLMEFIELMLGKVPKTEDGLLDLLTAEGKRAILEKLEPTARMAFFAYQHAESKSGKKITDEEAFVWLQENPIKSGHRELDEYVIPSSVDTFGRYLREARSKLGESKYEKRIKRPIGRSIVSGHQI